MNGVVAVSKILHSGKVAKFTSRLHSPGVGFEFIFGLLSFLLCPRPVEGGGHQAVIGVRRPSVHLSDVAYIGSNSKTKRPRKTKLYTGVPQVTCDSHTDFKVKRSKVKVSRGRGILWRLPSRTACYYYYSITVFFLDLESNLANVRSRFLGRVPGTHYQNLLVQLTVSVFLSDYGT